MIDIGVRSKFGLEGNYALRHAMPHPTGNFNAVPASADSAESRF